MDPQRQHRRTERAQAAPPTRVWPVACWIFVLAAIGVVQIVRMQWFDAGVFFVMATLVSLDARGGLMRRSVRRIGLPWIAGGAALVGAAMCFLPRHSPGMQVLTVAVGAIAVILAFTGAAVAHPELAAPLGSGIRRLALAWAVIVVIGCVWELVQFILGLVQPTATWFSLSDLLNPAVTTVPGKVLFVALWFSGGVWLLRRGGAR